MEEGVIIFGKFLESGAEEAIGKPFLAAGHDVADFVPRLHHKLSVPCEFIGTLALGDLVEVLHHEDEAIVLVVEIVLLALPGLELSLEETLQGLGFLHPLKYSEHWPHWNYFKPTNLKLFFVGFGILQEASVY